eukprot:CAMPEP_0116866362 /NCGR_PEP_ID=MMETSP0418-20121206/25980_1 /TAXON_ID=1158023 /ORGANISM="Astrosyne radiata, Strain 13vi08-1A" /LENGTH=812 /DNA_ID=CAMNT_0004501975 /DNA_START=803 /DNA_END=3241 /DNA_ORIENTATION=-
MAKSIEQIPGEFDKNKKIASLEQRRGIILAIVGSTPPNNEALKRSLSNGLLASIRLWLEDILQERVGGVDLLLLMLTSMRDLPVTRSMVKETGLGKRVGSIEKQKISAGTMNESAIMTRVKAIKDAWNKSVKAHQSKDSPDTKKRRAGSLQSQGPKKTKVDDGEKKGSFSNLLKKISTPKSTKSNPISKPPISSGTSANTLNGISKTIAKARVGRLNGSAAPAKPGNRKSTKRVKWADHFGGNLESTREIEGNRGEQPADAEEEPDSPVSWTDRRKRDRLREKELLEQVKKSKLVDDDEDIFSQTSMRPKIAWHQPRRLPDRPEITKPQLDSKEFVVQSSRLTKVTPVRYMSIDEVPNSPAPMSDVEQALEMTQQTARTSSSIPFFAPQQTAPEPTAAPPPPTPPTAAPYGTTIPPPPSGPATSGATAEMVQAMGLPLFLVGSNIQALQTLAATPSLLNTFVDANGMYDQQRLTSLVQTLSLSQNLGGSTTQPAQPQYNTGAYSQTLSYNTSQQYGVTQSSTSTPSPYGQSQFATSTPTAQSSTATSAAHSAAFAHNNEQRGSAGANLHLSGYGPSATQAEVIALFSPYVRVDEVVMKNGFCFVNTSDPAAAKQAKEALNGTLLGGMPVRINLAQRRSRDTPNSTSTANSALASVYGPGGATTPAPAPAPAPSAAPNQSSRRMIRNEAIPLPRNAMGAVDYESVRDDRGNPATKNLFVAGYGTGTSEQQLREIFGQHASITGCVMKGNFTFVNTSDRISAVNAREALTGTLVNGGVLRINFAKESGRLGTSFDLTYGPNTLNKGAPKSYYGP